MTTVIPLNIIHAPWVNEAVCAQTDPEIFFPEKGGDVLPALRICRTCPVQKDCLQWALDNHETYGVWGGMSYRERKEYQRNPDLDWHGTKRGFGVHRRRGEEPCADCRKAWNAYYRDYYNGRET